MRQHQPSVWPAKIYIIYCIYHASQQKIERSLIGVKTLPLGF